MWLISFTGKGITTGKVLQVKATKAELVWFCAVKAPLWRADSPVNVSEWWLSTKACWKLLSSFSLELKIWTVSWRSWFSKRRQKNQNTKIDQWECKLTDPAIKTIHLYLGMVRWGSNCKLGHTLRCAAKLQSVSKVWKEFQTIFFSPMLHEPITPSEKVDESSGGKKIQ